MNTPRAAIVFALLGLLAACEPHHRRNRPPSQVPMGDEWRVPTDGPGPDGGAPAKPSPSTQPAPHPSGEEIHI